jgi:hypothetical protein
VSLRIITGPDGKQYVEVDGRAQIPLVGPRVQPGDAYTIEMLDAMRTWPNPYLPNVDPAKVLADLFPESDPKLTMTAKTWLPGDPPARSEPEHPTGRFNNLDWEDGA